MKHSASRKIRLTACLLAALLIALYSCTKDMGVLPEPPPPPPPGFCDTITYTQDISPLVTDNCLSCHSAQAPSGNIVLETYDQLKTFALNGKLHGVISVGPPQFKWMPDGSANGLPEDQKAIFECWINNGTKQ